MGLGTELPLTEKQACRLELCALGLAGERGAVREGEGRQAVQDKEGWTPRVAGLGLPS